MIDVWELKDCPWDITDIAIMLKKIDLISADFVYCSDSKSNQIGFVKQLKDVRWSIKTRYISTYLTNVSFSTLFPHSFKIEVSFNSLYTLP